MIQKLLLLVVLVLLLSSCLADKSGPKTVILKHPGTLDFQSCKVADWGSEQAYRDNEKCVEAYRQQGYVIWGSNQ